MTTIVIDRKLRQMCADRQMTGSDGHKMYHQKINRTKYDGKDVLVATAGDGEANLMFLLWLEEQEKHRVGLQPDGEHKDVYYPTDTEFHALVLLESGDCLWFGSTGFPVEMRERFIGIGSGSGYALGALHAGADLRTSVKIACLLDSTSGMGIQLEGFEKPVKKRRRKSNG